MLIFPLVNAGDEADFLGSMFLLLFDELSVLWDETLECASSDVLLLPLGLDSSLELLAGNLTVDVFRFPEAPETRFDCCARIVDGSVLPRHSRN